MGSLMILVIKFLWVIAIFWHTLAFAAGGMNVVGAYRALFSGAHDPARTRAIRSAEWQLWASGLIIIGLGIVLTGWHSYLDNPKLWSKIVVVSVWLASTIVLRNTARHRWPIADRRGILLACSVSGACWIYGAFLGVAKPLANSVMPFWGFMAGFLGVLTVCIAVTFRHEQRLSLKANSNDEDST